MRSHQAYHRQGEREVGIASPPWLNGLVKPLSLSYSLTDDTIHIDKSAN